MEAAKIAKLLNGMGKYMPLREEAAKGTCETGTTEGHAIRY